ncbi:MAG: CDP-diacylglycerol--glycerol-3-phosphate 3-phosphatidyltransferase, partial [Verrucomicrobia bacterium]|nr:CDP-diacylglycerol--glycerol-3-phosphate 3-phosphatidyltransferase [Verrucomicrobiota bacterium]
MSIPIALTLSRILLGPLFIVVYIYYQEMGITLLWLPYLLIALAVLSELSD